MFGSETGELLITNFIGNAEFGMSNTKLDVGKRIRLGAEEKLISLAASKHLPYFAVGMINAVAIFDVKTHNRTNIVVPTQFKTKTIIWSMVFVLVFLLFKEVEVKGRIFTMYFSFVVKVKSFETK